VYKRLTFLFAILTLPQQNVWSDNVKFDVNDVSYLWPIAKDVGAWDKLLSAGSTPSGSSRAIWPKDLFDKVIAEAQQTSVVASSGTKSTINFGAFKNQFADPTNWKVVAFRIDPSAPGTLPMFTEAFGVIPQIRLILQPVTKDGAGNLKVHDVTVHLVFNFVERFDPPPAVGQPAKGIPDKVRFAAIVEGLKALKEMCSSAGVDTSGTLKVHPGLEADVPGFSEKVKEFLLTHLKDRDPSAVAFMGLDGSEPWIFFAMARQPNGRFELQRFLTLGNNSAQMITFRGGNAVMPQPVTSNLPSNQGVSTALLFRNTGDDPAAKLGKPVFANTAKPIHRDIPDIIANPKMANFFNTDCASCHTESTRRTELQISPAAAEFQYHLPNGISGVDAAVLPKGVWNVRNFGWFPRNGQVFPTATMRTGNEAAESAEAINHTYLAPQGDE
jgi:hypothetical protein